MHISSFYTSLPNNSIKCYTFSEIWCVTDVIVIFHFGLLFVFFTPLPIQKIKTKKKKKKIKHLKLPPFYTSAPKIMVIFYPVPEIMHVTDNCCFSFWAVFLKNQN